MSPRRMMELEELIECVENALDSSTIQVDVWETDRHGEKRTTMSSDPLYRLTRCLRSAGLLNEYVSERKERRR